MIDDSDQLERDLSYTPRQSLLGSRVRERPPPGANAVTAFGVLYTGGLWLVTLALLTKFGEGGAPSGHVVSPGACFTLVILGVEMFIAGALAGKTWRALGATARSVIRPFMFLGPWPIVIGGVLGFAMVSGVATGRFDLKGVKKTPPPSGENWRVVQLPRREEDGAKWPRAEPLCAKQGAGWKVPTPDELALFRPPLPAQRRTHYWLSSPTVQGESNLAWTECDGSDRCQLKSGQGITGVDSVAKVVCFKP